MSTKEAEIPSLADVKKFVYAMFRGKTSVRGETCGKRISFKTPCNDFFHADIDCASFGIAKPIEKQFGLEQFDFTFSMGHHSFCDRLGKHEKAFYKKYPTKDIGTPKDTLLLFCEMIYDLIRIKNGLDIT